MTDTDTYEQKKEDEVEEGQTGIKGGAASEENENEEGINKSLPEEDEKM